MTIGIVATIKVQDGKGEGLEAVFKDLAALVRANEPGNLMYALTKSRADPNTYKVLELYTDQAAVDAHGQSAHFRENAPKMGPFLAGRPDVEYLDGVCEGAAPMDLDFSPEDLAFQGEVRAFIAQAYDDDMRARMDQSKNAHMDRESQVRWLKRLGDKGWIAPDWPVAYGGTGWSDAQKYVFGMEMALAGAPSTTNMGLRMCAPVIMAFGSDTQKAQHLPKILSSDVWWCQGYSEPGSGSDLASLSMKAQRDGEDYVLNGSKIWTTYAQWADWMFCLVRTSVEDRPQKGISFLLLDMKTPGITIRPLPTLDGPIDGEQEINQVFFEDVRVPVANRIGEEGQGWTYAKYLLQFERGNAYAPGLTHQLDKVKKIAATEASDTGEPLIRDRDFRRKLADMQIKVEAINATELKLFAGRASGEAMGPVSSMLKLEGSMAQQAITELALEAVGIYGAPFVADTWAHLRGGVNEPRPGPDYAAPAAPYYFNYRKTSIYAGSNEIQHNIMAKMILGL